MGGLTKYKEDGAMSDTWEWDGRIWTLVSTDGPTLIHFGMAYDRSREVIVLYGGRPGPGRLVGNVSESDTWEWDGETWKQITTGEDDHPLATPAMAYDPRRGKVIRHGGTSDDLVFDQDTTWEWDGERWTQIATGFIHGSGKMIYDANRENMVVFVGMGTGLFDARSELREFDGTHWDRIAVADPTPSPRVFTGFVFDSHRGVAVLYGGGPNRWTFLNDTWEWDGAQWTKMNIPGPGKRTLHAMAYDSKRRKVVVFGGQSILGNVEPFLNDTWEYGVTPAPNINTPVNFPDPAFRSAWRESVGVEPGESFTADQAAEVKSIDVSGNWRNRHRGKIKDVTGIEFFTGLKEFRCEYNALTNLDVSNNTALEELDCWGNFIVSLDVSRNTALKFLKCSENRLPNLDVSISTAMELLDCSGNQLTSLDLTNNTALVELQCYSNRLTGLDLTNNTALESLSCRSNQLTSLALPTNAALKSLSCGGNQLTSLDLTNNTALESLSCGGNQLTSLNLTNSTALKSLDCIGNQFTSLDLSGNTALETLDCYGNQLTSLDLTNNTALESLACSGNQLTSLDLTNSTALKSLSCGGNQLTSLDLTNNTALESLSCGGNQLTSLDLTNNTALESLWCSGNQLTSIASFRDLENLVSLDVTYNNLDIEDCNDINILRERLGETFDGWFSTVGFNFSPQNGSDPYDCLFSPNLRLEITGLNPVRLSISGAVAARGRVERSSNLLGWEEWVSFTLGKEPRILTDRDARETGARYYRAISR